MNQQEIFAELQAFLVDMLDIDAKTVTPQSQLWGELDIDSLSVLELAVFTEEKFDVELEDALNDGGRDSNDRSHMTVGWLVDQITAKRTEVAAG